MGPQVRAIGKQVHVFEEVVFFESVHGNLEADVVGVLAKRPDIRYDHGFAKSECTHQSSGVFADRGITQVEDDVASRAITYEIIDGRETKRATKWRRPC